jgi:hypothetical protein
MDKPLIPTGAGFRNHPQYDGVADADHLFISNCQVGPELPTGPTCQNVQKWQNSSKIIQRTKPPKNVSQSCQNCPKLTKMKK